MIPAATNVILAVCPALVPKAAVRHPPLFASVAAAVTVVAPYQSPRLPQPPRIRLVLLTHGCLARTEAIVSKPAERSIAT